LKQTVFKYFDYLNQILLKIKRYFKDCKAPLLQWFETRQSKIPKILNIAFPEIWPKKDCHFTGLFEVYMSDLVRKTADVTAKSNSSGTNSFYLSQAFNAANSNISQKPAEHASVLAPVFETLRQGARSAEKAVLGKGRAYSHARDISDFTLSGLEAIGTGYAAMMRMGVNFADLPAYMFRSDAQQALLDKSNTLLPNFKENVAMAKGMKQLGSAMLSRQSRNALLTGIYQTQIRPGLDNPDTRASMLGSIAGNALMFVIPVGGAGVGTGVGLYAYRAAKAERLLQDAAELGEAANVGAKAGRLRSFVNAAARETRGFVADNVNGIRNVPGKVKQAYQTFKSDLQGLGADLSTGRINGMRFARADGENATRLAPKLEKAAQRPNNFLIGTSYDGDMQYLPECGWGKDLIGRGDVYTRIKGIAAIYQDTGIETKILKSLENEDLEKVWQLWARAMRTDNRPIRPQVFDFLEQEVHIAHTSKKALEFNPHEIIDLEWLRHNAEAKLLTHNDLRHLHGMNDELEEIDMYASDLYKLEHAPEIARKQAIYDHSLVMLKDARSGGGKRRINYQKFQQDVEQHIDSTRTFAPVDPAAVEEARAAEAAAQAAREARENWRIWTPVKDFFKTRMPLTSELDWRTRFSSFFGGRNHVSDRVPDALLDEIARASHQDKIVTAAAETKTIAAPVPVVSAAERALEQARQIEARIFADGVLNSETKLGPDNLAAVVDRVHRLGTHAYNYSEVYPRSADAAYQALICALKKKEDWPALDVKLQKFLEAFPESQAATGLQFFDDTARQLPLNALRWHHLAETKKEDLTDLVRDTSEILNRMKSGIVARPSNKEMLAWLDLANTNTEMAHILLVQSREAGRAGWLLQDRIASARELLLEVSHNLDMASAARIRAALPNLGPPVGDAYAQQLQYVLQARQALQAHPKVVAHSKVLSELASKIDQYTYDLMHWADIPTPFEGVLSTPEADLFSAASKWSGGAIDETGIRLNEQNLRAVWNQIRFVNKTKNPFLQETSQSALNTFAENIGRLHSYTYLDDAALVAQHSEVVDELWKQVLYINRQLRTLDLSPARAENLGHLQKGLIHAHESMIGKDYETARIWLNGSREPLGLAQRTLMFGDDAVGGSGSVAQITEIAAAKAGETIGAIDHEAVRAAGRKILGNSSLKDINVSAETADDIRLTAAALLDHVNSHANIYSYDELMVANSNYSTLLRTIADNNWDAANKSFLQFLTALWETA
jgi:hypothetical protein